MRGIIIIALLVTFSGLQSCKINWSFTGANIHPDAKTFSVQFFPNRAPLVQPSLSQVFTEGLKDRMSSQTNLQLINGMGQLNFEGEITGYSVSPVAIQGDETAALNRLTISVKVKFTNTLESKWDYNNSFSAYEDFSSSQNLSDIEDEIVKTIVEKLTEDIFNKSVANW